MSVASAFSCELTCAMVFIESNDVINDCFGAVSPPLTLTDRFWISPSLSDKVQNIEHLDSLEDDFVDYVALGPRDGLRMAHMG